MTEYQHVMYTSKSSVEQVYSELFGEVDELEIEKGGQIEGTAQGKLRTFFSMISGRFSGRITRKEIHSINFDDEMRKAKKIANSLLTDEEIPDISEVEGTTLDTSRLYRFSCEVMTRPFESEIDGENYIEVSGNQNGIQFRGDTSTENWGSRSHIIQSVRAAKHDVTYPYQGLMWPLSKTAESGSVAEYDVKYLLICGPERQLREQWHERNAS